MDRSVPQMIVPIAAVEAPMLHDADTRTSKDLALEDGAASEGGKSS